MKIKNAADLMVGNKEKTIRYLLLIVFATFLIIISVNTSYAIIDNNKCKDCHGKVIPFIRGISGNITKECLICHSTHGLPLNCCQPETRDPVIVHDIHENAGEGIGVGGPLDGGGSRGCARCHQAPVSCSTCHNTHEMVKRNDTGIDVNKCTNCHGSLPNPRGHESFRSSLKSSKHGWMNCGTCHKNYKKENNSLDFNIKFKDMMTVSIQESNNLCKICHSYQYNQYIGKVDGNHPKSGKMCVDCHNPHTTTYTGPRIDTTPKKETNLSTIKSDIGKTLENKFPAIKNPLVLLLFVIIGIAVIAEYILSMHEKGTKVAYNMIKVSADEENLITLEIRLTDKNPESVYNVLDEFHIDIVGTTLSKKVEGENIIYVLIIFVDTKGIDINEEDLIGKINEIDNISSVIITEDYEL